MEVNIFLDNLKTDIYGKNFFLFKEIESTNKKMLEDLDDSKINKNLKEGTVYLALRQTKGIGSFGNDWKSDNVLGLWLTILLYSPFKKEPLTFVPAIALAKLLKEQYNISAKLKWPNDVLIKSKKVSGILCQVKQVKNSLDACALGIGINVLQEKKDFSKDIEDKATSIKMETSKSFEISEVFQLFMKYFENTYENKENIIEEWLKYSDMIGKKIKAKKDGEDLEVIVKGLTKEGYLQVENKGKTETWISRTSLDIDPSF